MILGGEGLIKLTVPQGKVDLVTVSSIALSGVLLKGSVLSDCRFGSILQVRNNKPFWIAELIEGDTGSLDTAQRFIASKMTQVG